MTTVREQIEARAYQLFLARGGVHGYHMEDWTQAEKETLSKQASPQPRKAPAKKAATKKAAKK